MVIEWADLRVHALWIGARNDSRSNPTRNFMTGNPKENALKTLSILAASAATMAVLAQPATAGAFKFNSPLSERAGLVRLAQAEGQAECPEGQECPAQPVEEAPAEEAPAAEAPPAPAEQPAEAAEQPAEQPAEKPAEAAEQPVEQAPAAEQTVVPEQSPRKQRKRDAEAAPQQEQPAQQAEEPRRERERQKAEEPRRQRDQRQAEEPRRQRDQRQAEEPRRQRDQRQAEEPRRQRDGQRAERRDRDGRGSFADLLRDDRSAGDMTDAELRLRIELFNAALQSGQVDGRLERRTRRSLDAYRGELERRISAATGRDVGGIDARREARRILQDDRRAERMRDDALRERIQDTRTVLSLPGLDPRFEDRLRNRLAEDRQELRSRVARAERPERRDRFDAARGDRRALRRDMIQAREERRRRLRDRDYQIVIPDRPARRRVPLATIPLAEAYDEQLVEQLMAPPAQPIERRYSIDEYRADPSLRTLMPGIEVDTVKFGFNEDFLREEEILKLDRIGEIMERIIAGNPDEVFLIEGHTDLVGSDAYNEELSWRRAEAVRNALTEFFYIPERNLEIVGYGEEYPRIPTEAEEPENRRSTIRRITPILTGQR